MKKTFTSGSKTKQKSLLITLIIFSFICIVATIFLFWRKSLGDFSSVCEAEIENASLSELHWDKIYNFYFLNNQGIFTQSSNNNDIKLLVPGKIDDYRVSKVLSKIVYIENQKLWLVNLDGTSKTELTTFPDSKSPYIEGLSADEKNLLVVLQNQKEEAAERDILEVDLVSQKIIPKRGLVHEIREELGVQQVRHHNTSLSPNGLFNIELKDGKFLVNSHELFYCGTVSGTVGTSGPACYQHNWLDDNEHIVIDLCGAVIVEVPTGKVARLNTGRNIDW